MFGFQNSKVLKHLLKNTISYAHTTFQNLPLWFCLILDNKFFILSKLQNECIDAIPVLLLTSSYKGKLNSEDLKWLLSRQKIQSVAHAVIFIAHLLEVCWTIYVVLQVSYLQYVVTFFVSIAVDFDFSFF